MMDSASTRTNHQTNSNVVDLQPSSMGEILDRAIRLYRQNFINFVGILAVVLVPLTLFQMLINFFSLNQFSTFNPEQTAEVVARLSTTLGGSAAYLFLHVILVQGVAGAALATAIANSYAGKNTSVLSSYRQAKSLWVRLLAAVLISSVVSIAITIFAIFIPCIGWFTGFGALIFFTIVVIPLIAPVIVFERQTISDSIRRAWDLGRRRIWWMVGFALIIYIFSFLLTLGPTALLQVGVGFFIKTDLASNQIFVTSFSSLISMVGSLVILPLQNSAFILTYLDLRVRSEGLDLAFSVAKELNPLEDLRSIASASAPKPEKELVSGKDIGAFVLLSLIVAGLYVVAAIIILVIGFFMSGLY